MSQKQGKQFKTHFDAVNRTKRFFSQQITFVTKCENTEFCFKRKRLIKIILVILRQNEREPQNCLCGRRGVRTSPAKPIPCLGIKNNALLLGP